MFLEKYAVCVSKKKRFNKEPEASDYYKNKNRI